MSAIGIYKITSPSGKVYIGQSHNILKRFSKYKRISNEVQRKLYNSLLKYGWDNHIKELIHELPKDISQVVLNTYEILYMDLYKQCGIDLLNITSGGSKGKHSTETIKKMSDSAKKRGYNIPKGYVHSFETRQKISLVNKGKMSWNKGIKASEITRKRQSNAKIGKTIDKCPNSKKIICQLTNKIYNSIGEAADILGIKRTTLNAYLTGQTKVNRTSLQYLKNG